MRITIIKTEFLVSKNTWPSPDHCKQLNEGEAVAEKSKLEQIDIGNDMTT